MRELFKRIWSLLFGEEEVDLGSPLEIHQAINKVGTTPTSTSQTKKVAEEVSTPVTATPTGEEIQPSPETEISNNTTSSTETDIPAIIEEPSEPVSYQTDPISETSTYSADEFIEESTEEVVEEVIEEVAEEVEDIVETTEELVEEDTPNSEEQQEVLTNDFQNEGELSPEDEYERFERELLAQYQKEQEETNQIEEAEEETVEIDPQSEFDSQLEVDEPESELESISEDEDSLPEPTEELTDESEEHPASEEEQLDEEEESLVDETWTFTNEEESTISEEEVVEAEEELTDEWKLSAGVIPEPEEEEEIDYLNPVKAEEIEQEALASEEVEIEELNADEPLTDEEEVEASEDELEELATEEEVATESLTDEEELIEEGPTLEPLTDEDSSEDEPIEKGEMASIATTDEAEEGDLTPVAAAQDEEEIPEGFALERIEYGDQGTLGMLYLDGEFVSFTLENTPEKAIPNGTYALSLRNEGGKHATYYFRFKEEHKGMLWLKNADSHPYAMIHIGSIVEDNSGGIILGTSYQNGVGSEKWSLQNSEEAYLKIYDKLADRLLDGQEVILHIHTSA